MMGDRYAAQRNLMIEEQLLRRGLHDPRLLAAFRAVPRHLFTPVAARSASYDDIPLPIGRGQTISQPYMVALMTNALALTGDERVLEVGTGSGYQCAILAQMASEVHTIELLPELSAQAARVCARLHLNNIVFHLGDGSMGWPECSPYDAIIVTAAAPAPPEPLLQQLVVGGRIVVPVVASHGNQLLKVLVSETGGTSEHELASVAFVPLRGRHGIQA
jgi:protein-L-isoaspartate(D-aspartate) O-methyltransferase